jgi:GxxExxY protein
MPIACPIQIRNLTPSEFDERDAVVMRFAYAAQNALGRLCDERVYENDLARRLRAAAFKSVHTQVPVTVSHDGFAKEYRFDLVAEDALYELKTAGAFASQHDAQALHYAMLAKVNHAKLLNFRTGKVQGKLLFNVLLDDERRVVRVEDAGWSDLSPQCEMLRRRLRRLLADWGGGLDFRLYEEALVHFNGGEDRCVRRIPICLEGLELGSHAVNSHADGLFFLVTTFTESLEHQRRHIARLLALTPMRAVQWINLNHTTAQLQTIAGELDKRVGANE